MHFLCLHKKYCPLKNNAQKHSIGVSRVYFNIFYMTVGIHKLSQICTPFFKGQREYGLCGQI